MKIVFFGYDFSADVLKRLVEDGHETLSVFSFETDNVFSFNARLEELAKDTRFDKQADARELLKTLQ